jgi:hypothetical protein
MFLTPKIAVALLVVARSASATNYVTTAANGTGIPHPPETKTDSASADSTTTIVPKGMFCIPTGNRTFTP